MTRPRTAALAGLVVVLAACGGPDLLDPTEEPLASDRERLVAHMTAGLEAAADQLLAGETLGTREETVCEAGEENWKYSDSYRSRCEISVSAGFPLDEGIEGALGDREGLTAFEERLAAEGWGSPGWHLAGNDPGVEVSVQDIRDHRLPVSDVLGVRLAVLAEQPR